MAFPRVSGHPDYTRAGTSQFIPEIWSTKFLIKFYDATVLSDVTNTEYEGLIRGQGDTVIVRTVPNVTITTYNKGMKLNYERLESPSVQLKIDKGKYFGLVIDRVDKVQADVGLMDSWSADAAEQMKIAIDQDVLQNIVGSCHASNRGATAGVKTAVFNMGVATAPVTVTKTNILDYIVDAGTVLDEQNVPESGRFMIIPPWMAGLIKKSDLKDASLTGDGQSVIRNGRLGMIDRYTLYNSNNLKTATEGASTAYYILHGTKQATTFASQITDVETLKAESTFGDIVRGLNVYGYKVMKTEALGELYAIKG